MLLCLEEAKHLEATDKAKLEEEIMAKQMEVHRIQDEVNAKDEETKRLQDEVEEALRKRDLLAAQEMIRRLEEQLKQLQAAKDELQLHQKELQGMLLCLEEAKHLEATDKAKLEEEIMAKQMEVQRIQD
ncbi:hypothetical protein KR038_009257 [Drosophila bunnanda]|nr:hypothetical protein KR038_009257 [Drosophila bunnanda]